MEHGMTMEQYEKMRKEQKAKSFPDWVEPDIEQAKPVLVDGILSELYQSSDSDHWLHQPPAPVTWLPEDKDMVNPEHYKQLPKGVEVHEILIAVANRDLGFTENISYSDLCNCLKYLLRLGLKNGTLEELKKVQWYLNAIIEREETLSERKDQETDPIGCDPEVPDTGKLGARPTCNCGHRDKAGDDFATVYRPVDGDPDGLRRPNQTEVKPVSPWLTRR